MRVETESRLQKKRDLDLTVGSTLAGRPVLVPSCGRSIAQRAELTTGMDRGEVSFASPLMYECLTPLSFDSLYVAATREPEPSAGPLVAVTGPLALALIRRQFTRRWPCDVTPTMKLR